MGRLSDVIKQAAPKRRKLAGLERRWLVNNVSVMVVTAIVAGLVGWALAHAGLG